MNKRQVILGLKKPSEFSLEERKMIIEEYLRFGGTKRAIWRKYTGQGEEKGCLLKWMRQLGYADGFKGNRLASNYKGMSTHKYLSDENIQLKEKIAQLEKALVESELRATAMETMIEIAEKELKISIRKKSNTKRSIK